MSLVEKITTIHQLLDAGDLPHAFGGALALAWCTQEPRGTSDVDVNVFISSERADVVLSAIASVVSANSDERNELITTGQVRLWWDVTPIDLFLNNTTFHEDLVLRVRHHEFAGGVLPFLGCEDLAVFKAFFDRPKDWVDVDTMISAHTVRPSRVAATLAELLGADDHRTQNMQSRIV
jgi:hypothetical protein